MHFSIPGIPHSQKRARKGKYGFYNPQSREKKQVQYYLLAQMNENGFKMLCNDPIKVKVTFHMPIPKSFSKSLKNKLRESPHPHIVKPDIDNLIKFILDCMTGIVYQDDNCIYRISSSKTYSQNPSTKVFLSKL